MQVPSNLVVSKIKWPGLYICAAVALWGVVSACTAAVNSFGSLVACRFMLGFVEVFDSTGLQFVRWLTKGLAGCFFPGSILLPLVLLQSQADRVPNSHPV